MAWIEESDEQTTQEWQSRIARKRQDLSASVEETLGETSLPVEEEEEWGEESENSVPASKGTLLIPPRLSLQSKELTAIRSQAPTGAERIAPPSLAGRGHEGRMVESGNIIARVAHRISSTLSSLERVPRKDSATASFPRLPTDYSDRSPMRSGTIPASRPSEMIAQTGSKQGVTKRTTKVRLQVVPKTDAPQGVEKVMSSLSDIATNPSLPAIQQTDGRLATPPSFAHRADVSGSGKFECGQADVAVANTHITATSVVVVMLAGDPGPVVVQYISLQPTIGFTVHLSASTKFETPFNYTIIAQ